MRLLLSRLQENVAIEFLVQLSKTLAVKAIETKESYKFVIARMR